jgi:hypothetical protein
LASLLVDIPALIASTPDARGYPILTEISPQLADQRALAASIENDAGDAAALG